MQHMTMQKKHTSCLPCFLKFVNSVLPVLGTAIGTMFIMIFKKGRKGHCFSKYQSTRDIFMLFPRSLLWKSSFGSSFSIFFQLKLPFRIYLYISNASLEVFF